MADQAEGLRKKDPDVDSGPDSSSLPRVISVTSGKGGVGKTNVTANLAYAFSETFGKRVLVFDADLGLGNMDVLFNLRPRWTLKDFLFEDRPLSDVLVSGPAGIRILPAASGVEELTALTPEQNLKLISAFDQLGEEMDILLIDTGAGISENVLTFNLASQETLIVVTPEPTSRTDAFALMKVLNRRFSGKPLLFLANMVRDRREGLELYDLVSRVADRFLPDLNLSFAGYLPQDPSVTPAVRNQKALAEMLPGAPFSAAIRQVARDLLARPPREMLQSGIGLLMKRLVESHQTLKGASGRGQS
ncbi:MAG: MinD/ParA family protein [Leptospirales bacterium]